MPPTVLAAAADAAQIVLVGAAEAAAAAAAVADMAAAVASMASDSRKHPTGQQQRDRAPKRDQVAVDKAKPTTIAQRLPWPLAHLPLLVAPRLTCRRHVVVVFPMISPSMPLAQMPMPMP